MAVCWRGGANPTLLSSCLLAWLVRPLASSNEYVQEADAERAVQLVRRSSSGDVLEVTKEGHAWLVQLGPSPLSVVVVTGAFRTGKSSLLNRLMGRGPFAVNDGVDPNTQGLWAARTNKTLFIDSAGLGAFGTSEHMDAKLFGIATLFASMLLYNTRQLVDARQLEYLDLLARRASLFGIRTALHNLEESSSWIKMPPLVWIVQNVASKLSSDGSSSWLQRSAGAQAHLNGAPLLELFPSLRCILLAAPSADSEVLQRLDLAAEQTLSKDYQEDLGRLRKLIDAGGPKQVGKRAAGGPALAQLLSVLVEAAQEELMPALPSLWSVFEERARAVAQGDCERAYDTMVEHQLTNLGDRVMTATEADELHSRGVRACLPVLAAAEMNASEVLRVRRDRLTKHIAGPQERACTSARERARQRVVERGAALQLPLAAEQLDTWVADEVEQALSAALHETNGLGCTGLDAVRQDLGGVAAQLTLRNVKVMTEALVALERSSFQAITVPKVLASAEVSQTMETAMVAWAGHYDSGASFAGGQHFAEVYRARAHDAAKAHCRKLIDAAQVAADDAIHEAARTAVAKLQADIDQLMLPVPEAKLAEHSQREMRKASDALKLKLSIFHGQPSFLAVLEELVRAGKAATQARSLDNKELISARIAGISKSTEAKIAQLPPCPGASWQQLLEDALGTIEPWPEVLSERKGLQARLQQTLNAHAKNRIEECRIELRERLHSNFSALGALADKCYTVQELRSRILESLAVEHSQTAAAALLEVDEAINELVRTRPLLVFTRTAPFVGLSLVLAGVLWHLVRQKPKTEGTRAQPNIPRGTRTEPNMPEGD